jgi:sarcosine oxidase delta subunit
LETTYEGTKLVKSAKLQMLISKFEEIKMLEEERFGEFYSKMSGPEELHDESWETYLGCKTHLKNSQIFA